MTKRMHQEPAHSLLTLLAMKCQRRVCRVGIWREILLFAVVMLALVPSSVRASWKTESFILVPGWNAIYLHLDVSHKTLDLLLKSHTPISQVWQWDPVTSEAQFTTDVLSEAEEFDSNWSSWDAEGSTASDLDYFIANAGYLVYVEDSYTDGIDDDIEVSKVDPYTLELTGKAVPPVYNWTASGQNLIGFPVPETVDGDRNFTNFLNYSSTLNGSSTKIISYPGGEFGDSNPEDLIAPDSTVITRGTAYWIFDEDYEYNRYFGTFDVTLQDLDGVHFGTSLSAYSMRLSNTSTKETQIRLDLVRSLDPEDGTTIVNTPPLLVRGGLDPDTLTYGFATIEDYSVELEAVPITLAAEGSVGSAVEIVFGIDRASFIRDDGSDALEGDEFGAILRFTDDVGFTQIDIPVTATKGTLAGLWVGEAEITQVQQDLSEFDVDDDGDTALDDEGAAVVSTTDLSYGSVARSYPLRLIMHMDKWGTTRLLQRIYYGLDGGQYDEEEDAIIPMGMLATTEGALNQDYLNVARRITAVHLPWSEENSAWEFTDVEGAVGMLDHSSYLVTTVVTDHADQASNPFLHTYHPDHDNKDAEFSATLDEGYESYDIVREISLSAGTAFATEEVSTNTSSDDSETVTETVEDPDLPSGITLVSIPQGSFVMGNADAEGPLADAHVPEKRVYMSSFEMSEAEITVQQYVEFLNAAWADGLIEILEDDDGTFVVGASGQNYEGQKFIELSGSRVLKDHDEDGDIDPENPLNQCWVEFDGDGVFSVKRPEGIDWDTFEYSDTANLITPSEWNTLIPADAPTPLVIQDGDRDATTDVSFQLDGARHMILVDNFAFVCSNERLHAINVADPFSPEMPRSGRFSMDNPIHISTNGEYLYVCSYDNNVVQIFNISELTDSSSSLEWNTIDVNKPRATAVSGNYLYCVSDDGIVRVYDLADPFTPALENSVTLSFNGASYNGEQRWIEIEDERAFIPDFSKDSIIIIDLSQDPTGLSGVTHVISDEDTDEDGNLVSLLDGVLFCHINNGILYAAANEEDAVSVFDVSFDEGVGPVIDNSAPVLIATMLNGVDGFELEHPRQMKVADNNVLYLTSVGDGDAVNVVDVSEPDSPNLIDVYKLGVDGLDSLDGPISVEYDDKALYVLSHTSDAMNIFELNRDSGLLKQEEPYLANSTTLVLQNEALDSGEDETFALESPRQVVAVGQTAFVADNGGNTISVLDISDPTDVEILKELTHDVDGNQLSNLNHLSLTGDLLIATAFNSDRFSIYDVSDPAAPDRLAIIQDNVDAPNLNGPIMSTVSGKYLFVTDVGGVNVDFDAVTIFDISDPSEPQFVNELISGANDSNGATFRASNATITVDGSLLCIANTGTRIQLVDVKDPTDPIVLSEIEDGVNGFNYVDSPRYPVIRNDYLFFSSAADEDAITIADVSDPTKPVVVAELKNGDGTYSALDGVVRIILDGGILYAPAGESGALTVVDVSDPSSPMLLEEIVNGQEGFDDLVGANSVAVADNKVIVTAADASAITIVTASVLVGETLDSWPELTQDLPTEAEVSNWPATFVKWHGAKAFADYYGCDLPTEAQWEYAAKGNNDLDFATDNGTIDVTRANYNEYNLHPDPGHVEAVKSYAPNPFGLYDMSGNVWEWCLDWFDPDYYENQPKPDYDPNNKNLVLLASEPIESDDFVGGPGQDYNGDARVKRGGSWNFHESSLHAAERERDYTWRGNDHFGFRIVRESFSVEAVELADFTALSSSASELSGTYFERITLVGKEGSDGVYETKEYNIAGEFKLVRISEIDELTGVTVSDSE